MMLVPSLARHDRVQTTQRQVFVLKLFKQKHSQFMKNKPKSTRSGLLFLMKVTLIQMLISSVTMVFAYAVNSNGQGVLERKVSVEFTDAKVKDVLAEIEAKTGVSFTYRPRVLRSIQNVNLKKHLMCPLELCSNSFFLSQFRMRWWANKLF
jgi:hypothetical protein